MNWNWLHKTCKECWIEKELYEFYKHPQWVLWTLPRCKECICKWRKTERERSMSRINDKKRNSCLNRKIQMNNNRIKFRIKYPEKYRAHKLVSNFFKNNKELKPIVSYISWDIWIIHLHHLDYNKPNEVIPCTPKEHSDIHKWIIDIKDEYVLILPF